MFPKETDAGIPPQVRLTAHPSPRESGDAASETILEIDGALTGPALTPLQDTLREALRAVPGPVILDLRGVPEIDSDGLSFLLRAHQELARQHRPLTLRVAAGGQPERVLRLGNFAAIVILTADTDGPGDEVASRRDR